MSEIKDGIEKITINLVQDSSKELGIGQFAKTLAGQIVAYLRSKGCRVDMTIRTEGDMNYPYEYKTGDIKIRFATPPSKSVYIVLIPEEETR